MENIRECPQCGQPLQATICIPVSRVVVNEDGVIQSAGLAIATSLPHLSALVEFAQYCDPTEARVYCVNDHPLGEAKKHAKTKKRSVRRVSAFDHADPRNR